MTNVLIQARISPELRRKADKLFDAMGLTTADAIRIFLTQSVNMGGLPFQPRAEKVPNAKTRAAIQELEAGRGRKFKNTQEFYDSLGI